jgi:Chaperone of endosialidase
MNLLRRLLPGIALILGTFLLSVGLQAFAVWTPPTGAPSSATNAYAPLNIGPTAQTKSGGLNVTGSVGIGTASPGSKLHVYGGRTEIGSTAQNYLPTGGTWNYTLLLDALDTSSIGFHDSGASVSSIRYDTSGFVIGGDDGWGVKNVLMPGNVGIGTASPGAKLEVAGQVKITGGIPGTGKVLTSDASGLATWTTPASGGLTGSGSTNYISKWTGATSLGNSVIYDNGTNVGIGTASPSEKLHVNGSVYVGGNWYKAGNLTSVNNAIGVWSAEGGVLSGFSSGRAVAIGQTTSGYTGLGISSGATPLGSFYYDHFSNETVVEAYGARNIRFSTNGATRMTVTSGGNVGIGSGMSSPWAQLDVGGSVGTNGVAFRAMDNTFSRYIMMVPYLGTGGYSGVSRSGDSGLFSAPGTGLVISPWNTSGIRINSSGNVGIGTGDPGYRLDVAGDINLTGCARNGGTVYAGTCVSDVRLKKNIEPLSGSLEKITALNPVSFEFNDSQYGTGLQEGLIAQEVERIFPDWVITGEDGYKRIRYDVELQLRLVEAIKEQQKEIDSLKARIDALEKK